MDLHNTFYTPHTAVLARLEWAGLLVVAAVLALTHLGAVNWLVFGALFVVIDVVGYLPGMLAYRRSTSGGIPRAYFVLYNAMHNLVTWTALLGLGTLVWGWQWAFLAVPIHLLGDRSLFGNSVKSFGVSFEPVTHPAFAEFQQRYAAAGPWRGAPHPSEPQEPQHAHA
ncbi:MAG: hypothetical protein ACOYBY_07260 [Dermatophilaceae bacterium]